MVELFLEFIKFLEDNDFSFKVNSYKIGSLSVQSSEEQICILFQFSLTSILLHYIFLGLRY